MILVKTNKDKKSKKITKFDLVTDITIPESSDIKLIDDIKQINSEVCKCKINKINKELEKARLICRSIECSASLNDILKSDDIKLIDIKKNRTKGKYIKLIDENNGIFIH